MRCSKTLEKPKMKQKKGLWSPDEDQKLRDYVINHGHGSWTSLPINAGLQRNGKSCRLRWINYLRPGLRRGNFTLQEEEAVFTLHAMLGNKWSQIAQHLPGRTDNEIKNYWHSYLKKKLPKSENPSTHTTTDDEPQTNSITKDNYNIEPSNSSLSSLNSLGQVEGSSSTTNNNVASNQLVLPKILFADWFALDQFNSQDLIEKYSTQKPILDNDLSSTLLCDTNNNFNDSLEFVHEQLFNDCNVNFPGLLNDDSSAAHDNSLNTGTSFDQMPQLVKFEDDQSLETELMDIISGRNNLCCDFDINDVMYI